MKKGYHKAKIKKGHIGEISKIDEELNELKDALNQKCTIMALVELSDLYGAIEAYVNKNFNIRMRDLKKMSKITKRAFRNGYRT